MHLVASVRPFVCLFVCLCSHNQTTQCSIESICLVFKGHRSMSRSNVWRAAVDIRGSALPSAAKVNNYHQV